MKEKGCATDMSEALVQGYRVTVIGAGVIGLSLAALYLRHLTPERLTLVDTRGDLEEHVRNTLPNYLKSLGTDSELSKILLTSDVAKGVEHATIIHEAGPENRDFKIALWEKVEKYAPSDAFFWSTSTGIPASIQNQRMHDRSRLLIVHAFNPPHILPLIEVVPSKDTRSDITSSTIQLWRQWDRQPILIKKEIPGFVAGRLAWALLREAIHLVNEDVVSVQEADAALEFSMGVRWAFAGPFKSFHAGGGAGGLEHLLNNVGETVQAVWSDLGDIKIGGDWREKVLTETRATYGIVDTAARDRANSKILAVAQEERSKERKG